ncbi:MAG: hypothetical protein GKR90_25360 [Pseudomonadales bacterium]|nr:hypothetical protein [Pseudomonadales bacterium]
MLNTSQQTMLEAVRAGTMSSNDALRTLLRFNETNYKQKSLREFLFALDGTLSLCGREWTDIFVVRMANWGGYIVDDVLQSSATTEIGQFITDYGISADTLALFVSLLEDSEKRPNNAFSFARRCFREFYNGIQPMTDERLLVLERFMRHRSFEPQDYDLTWHLVDETKGLENTERMPITFSIIISDRYQKLSHREKDLFVLGPLESVDEACPTVISIVERLKTNGAELSDKLLRHTDQTLDLLSGSVVQ